MWVLSQEAAKQCVQLLHAFQRDAVACVLAACVAANRQLERKLDSSSAQGYSVLNEAGKWKPSDQWQLIVPPLPNEAANDSQRSFLHRAQLRSLCDRMRRFARWGTGQGRVREGEGKGQRR